MAQSRLQAFAAASGGGATDPTVIRLGEGIEREGELQALTEFYKGENKARGYMDKAAARRMEGQAERMGSYFKAGGTFLDGAGSLFGKYR